LTQQEHEHVEMEGTMAGLDDASPGTFIVATLELQEAQ
jgi:hypothetical protein